MVCRRAVGWGCNEMKQSPSSIATTLASLLLIGLSGCGGGSSGSSASGTTPTPVPAGLPPIGSTGASSTPQQVVTAMAPGINLGNTMEAMGWDGTPPFTHSEETAWGAATVNQALFNGYAAAGFKSVRIPVNWSQYADANDNIPQFWLDRVKQVVDYAHNAGLYVIINIHSDSWVTADPTQAATVTAKMTKYWTQIANNFKDYDNHLLFAAQNETYDSTNHGSQPTAAECSAQTGYNQAFVNAVRAVGGNDASRTLVVQAYSTSIDDAVTCNATLPTDSIANRLIMEVHWYSPYDFALNSGDTTHWQYGALATDPSAVETWGNEGYTRQEFDKMQTSFVSKGIPVIMGEYGAYPKGSGPGKGVTTYTNYWAQYTTNEAITHGIVPYWWDTPGGMFDRNTGAVTVQGIVDAIMKGMTTNPEPAGSVGVNGS